MRKNIGELMKTASISLPLGMAFFVLTSAALAWIITSSKEDLEQMFFNPWLLRCVAAAAGVVADIMWLRYPGRLIVAMIRISFGGAVCRAGIAAEMEMGSFAGAFKTELWVTLPTLVLAAYVTQAIIIYRRTRH